MNTGKNRVKGLKTELFKKKFQAGGNEYNGRSLGTAVPSATDEFAQRMQMDAAQRAGQPLRVNTPTQYSPEQLQAMRSNFNLNSDDFRVDPLNGFVPLDLTAGQGIDDIRNQNQVLGQTEAMTSTPSNLSMFQNDQFNQIGRAEAENSLNAQPPNWLSRLYDQGKNFVKDTDWKEVVRTGAGALSVGMGSYQDLQNRNAVNQRIQNQNDRPRYMPNEYEYMGRPGSQSMIFAKKGAQIRTGSGTGAEEAELERGEMFMLPNMDTYHVGGKKHSQGGEEFVLPEGTIVFSDHLKVPGSKKTFADEAKKYDITKYKETLENPHAKTVDRDTAEILMNRNLKKLQQLFQTQQGINGNSNGEMKGSMRQGQKGLLAQDFSQEELLNYYNSVPFGEDIVRPANSTAGPVTTPTPITPSTTPAGTPTVTSVITQAPIAPYTPEQSAQVIANQTSFDTTPNKSTAEKSKEKLENLVGLQVQNEQDYQRAKAKIAAQVQANPGSLTGSTEKPALKTAAEEVGLTDADPTTGGTVGKTNATDPNSMYRQTTPDGRSYYVENQGEFKDKRLKEQYGGNPFNLVRNRLNEFGDQLGNVLLDSYAAQVGEDKDLFVGGASELVDVMESGNEGLETMRNYFKNIGQEGVLFDPDLDKGKDDNAKQRKTAELLKQYIESNQFASDVANGKASPYMPWLKGEIKEVKGADGKVRYTIDTAELDQTFVKKYQAAYRAFGAVKGTQKSKGKDDMLRGFRIAPEGLSDQQYMGLPISPVDAWGGNTTIGQISAFEDEEPIKKMTQKTPDPGKTTDPGNDYNTQLTEAATGKYTQRPFDYLQLAPELQGLASAQVFPYATVDSNAPYLMPQTLNIQPQLQDVDSSYVAALNAGADPNAAFIGTLNAKQRLYSEKQNFDAQQRASADQYNAQARWQEDITDLTSLDKVYNSLVAQSDDARTAQIQSLVTSASKKRALYIQEEERKKLYYNNFMRNYNFDGKTGQFSLSASANYDPFNFSGTNGQPTLEQVQQNIDYLKAQEEARVQKQTAANAKKNTTT